MEHFSRAASQVCIMISYASYAFVLIYYIQGAIDYAMLIAVKLGYIHRNTEKQANSIIQSWIRCPGCMIHVFLTFTSLIHNHNVLVHRALLHSTWFVHIAVIVVMSTVYWNGVYYQNRVVYNCGVTDGLFMTQSNKQICDAKEE
jgi:hypothetical protein